LLVVVVIVIRLVLGRRDDGALVGIDPDIEDLGPADDFHVIDPALLRVFVLGARCLAIGVLLGNGDGLVSGILALVIAKASFSMPPLAA
jgi:hypothetical protein